jgi:hypothetical protein
MSSSASERLARQPSRTQRRILASAGAATVLATAGAIGAVGSASAANAASAGGAASGASASGASASTSSASASSSSTARPTVHSWRGMSWPAAAAGSRRSVEFVDHTGWSWPVHAAARNWSGGSDVGYVPVSQCTPGAPCVQVHEGYYGATGWNGETLASPGLMNTFASPVTVQLNDSYAGTYSQHLGTACHELGHALGLDHASRQSSCMAASGGASTPDGSDLGDLELLYRG